MESLTFVGNASVFGEGIVVPVFLLLNAYFFIYWYGSMVGILEIAKSAGQFVKSNKIFC